MTEAIIKNEKFQKIQPRKQDYNLQLDKLQQLLKQQQEFFVALKNEAKILDQEVKGVQSNKNAGTECDFSQSDGEVLYHPDDSPNVHGGHF